MKRVSIILLVVVLLIMSLLVSCMHYAVPVAPIKINLPDANSFKADIPIYDAVVVAPSYLKFENVYAGNIIDTWTEAQYSDFRGYIVSYQKDDPLCITLYNPYTEVRTYEIAYKDADDEINTCKLLGDGIEYSKAPSIFSQYITLSQTFISVSPRSIQKIPFAIQVAEGIEYPKNWEFGIRVTDQRVINGANNAGAVRVFVCMR